MALEHVRENERARWGHEDGKSLEGSCHAHRLGKKAQDGPATARPLSNPFFSFVVYFVCRGLLKIHKEESYNESLT